MPNIIAYSALLFWPLACLFFFKRLRIELAILCSLLGGYLALPPTATFNFPLLPPMDKNTIPAVCVFLFCLLYAKRARLLIPQDGLTRAFILLFVLGSIPTVLANTDPVLFPAIRNAEPITFTGWGLPGLSIRDVISMLSGQMITLLPFLIARRFLASDEALRLFLGALAVAGLVYSIPALLEIRLSPQLNTWVYGFFQHDFVQTMRGDGFRPIVFLPHPLWLALFLVYSVVAAAALSRSKNSETRAKWVVAMLYLALVLALCKSLASLSYVIFLVPFVLFAGPRSYVRLAVVMALVATVYPLLRGAGFIPVDTLLAWSQSVDPDRAASLAYRFFNESELLQRAWEKPFLGWGGWGRNLVYDAQSGEILTIPDGRWIITFGTYGWLGYVSEFGLLALPVFLLARESIRGTGGAISTAVAAVSLLLAINMIDMLINATLTPITWMLSGAALGYAESMKARRSGRAASGFLKSSPAIGGVPRPTGPRTAI